MLSSSFFFFFQAEDGIRDKLVTGVQTCALPISLAIGVGLWLAALNARYRDVRYTIPFLTQIWLFATPIAYPSSLVPEPWRAWYGLNPMAGVVDGFRWALLGTADAPRGLMAVSAAVTLGIPPSRRPHIPPAGP